MSNGKEVKERPTELLELENKAMKEYLADVVCDVDEFIDELTGGRTKTLRELDDKT